VLSEVKRLAGSAESVVPGEILPSFGMTAEQFRSG